MDLMWIPVHRSWRLNERHYGSLQGLNKRDTVEKYGQEQVQMWRRSYEIRPPALDKTDKRNPVFDPRYAQLKNEDLPSVPYQPSIISDILIALLLGAIGILAVIHLFKWV